MIIYNVTIKVNRDINDQWLKWMREEHIPKMIGTGCFFRAGLLRLLEIEEGDGSTYAIQYHATSINDYQLYLEKHAGPLRQDTHEKWGDQCIAFRSVMEVLH